MGEYADMCNDLGEGSWPDWHTKPPYRWYTQDGQRIRVDAITGRTKIYPVKPKTTKTKTTKPKEVNMSEKNAAAMLRTDTKTVKVVFLNSRAAPEVQYTYVTHLNLVVDDLVVVPANDSFAVAKIVQVDDDLLIEPRDQMKYKWVATKVDFSDYEAQAARNSQIEDQVRDSYRHSARRSFAAGILGTLDNDAQAALQKLISGG